MKRIPSVSSVFFGFGCAVLAALPADAQQPGSLWLEPRIGWSFSAGELGRTELLAGQGYSRFDEVDSAPTLGVGIGEGPSSVAQPVRGFCELWLDESKKAVSGVGVWMVAHETRSRALGEYGTVRERAGTSCPVAEAVRAPGTEVRGDSAVSVRVGQSAGYGPWLTTQQPSWTVEHV